MFFIDCCCIYSTSFRLKCQLDLGYSSMPSTFLLRSLDGIIPTTVLAGTLTASCVLGLRAVLGLLLFSVRVNSFESLTSPSSRRPCSIRESMHRTSFLAAATDSLPIIFLYSLTSFDLVIFSFPFMFLFNVFFQGIIVSKSLNKCDND